jgi:zinc D-Ala-D-Ala dipeptidase
VNIGRNRHMPWLFHTTACVRCGAEHDPASPCREALIGRTLRAGLRLLERLGDTPNGELYRAEYPSGAEVAVLLLGTTATESVALTALQRRLRQAIRIQHPNVAAIHDLSRTPDGLIYLVAECLKGELLSQTLARRGALPLGEALDVFLQAAAGLQAAHAARCIHGNLSPESILLSPADGGTLVKLISFTLESPTGQQFDSSVVGKGSADYASPERLAGLRPDERSDVYSLGAVLHHLLTGVPPRSSEGDQVPDPIRPVLDRALAPFPVARRYQTVAEFVAAIAPLAEPVVHLIPEPTRSTKRNLVPLGAAAAALVVLSAGLWLLWGTQRLTLPELTRPGAQETGAVARAAPDSESASSPAPLAPAARPADSLSTSRVRRESVSSGRPAVSAPGPTASPPRPGDSAASGSLLVDVRSVDSTIQLDLRYATANNFTGAPLPGYEAPRALLRREVAAALGRVQARLRSKGLGLRVFDAYRPVRASLAMVDWAERTGNTALVKSGYIAKRSRHNLGVAVDLTLVDRGTGTELPMGTTFDDFTSADAHMANATGEALRYRQTLVRAMESEGFSPYSQTWWHFNYPLEGAVPLDRVIR